VTISTAEKAVDHYNRHILAMKFLLALPLVFPVACAFTALSSSYRQHSWTKLNLYQSVEEAIADAQRLCAEDPNGERCKVAWDIVEELEAADSHQDGVTAPNELNYEPLFYAMNILSTKVDRKMDELKALSIQLGPAHPSIERLAYLTDEMKEALAEVRSILPQ